MPAVGLTFCVLEWNPMSNGETITITITRNPKSGKSTIPILISEYLTQQGLRVLDDSDMNGVTWDSASENIKRIAAGNPRVVIEEKFYPPAKDCSPVSATVSLKPDGTYTIKQTR